MHLRTYQIILLLLLSQFANAQDLDISVQYGRFWAPYKYIDFGTGFKKTPESNYNFFPSVTLNKYYSKRLSAELGIRLTIYQQYFGTRLYKPAFASEFGAGHVTINLAYSILQKSPLEFRLKAGLGLGIAPDQYKGQFTEMLVYPVVDSISRGFIFRDYTAIYPTGAIGIDFSYKIFPRGLISVLAIYHKGVIKISEYDIFYNDGSGKNDQRARQWGTGDFYGVQLGFRYILRDKKNRENTDNKSRSNRHIQ